MNIVTNILKELKENTDMNIDISKVKVLHVRSQDSISKITNSEAQEICKFKCTHLHCDQCFTTKRVLTVHKTKCKWKEEYEVEKIINHKGPVTVRKFVIR